MVKKSDPQLRTQDPIICRCNGVKKSEIEKALQIGAKTLGEIYDQTTAGVGACGGSCRNKIRIMLEQFLKEQSSA